MTEGGSKRAKKSKKKKRASKKASPEQALASKCVYDWAFSSDSWAARGSSSDGDGDGFLPPTGAAGPLERRVVFELHSHSTRSDGYLSPAALVQRAHRNGVKVLALTDHDTMDGVPEAAEVARKLGIRIIPGVEISTKFSPREGSGTEEPVHVLAYYSSCGPSRPEELENHLASIRDGRYLRAKNMLLKLNKLKMPLKWEHIAKIAGNGVAPGRVHVARAMVEAGYVENLKQAFSRYLYDGGPAYATGNELLAEEAVQLICRTGGVAALAHPWALKNPIPIIRSLKAAGLHAIEVYRGDGKMAVFSDLADSYELLKIGGSDYHGRRSGDESDLGDVNLPVVAVHEFLKFGRPIWLNATKDVFTTFAEEPSYANLERVLKFCKVKSKAEAALIRGRDIVDLYLASWLTNEEREGTEFEDLRLKLSSIVINKGLEAPMMCR